MCSIFKWKNVAKLQTIRDPGFFFWGGGGGGGGGGRGDQFILGGCCRGGGGGGGGRIASGHCYPDIHHDVVLSIAEVKISSRTRTLRLSVAVALVRVVHIIKGHRKSEVISIKHSRD